MTKEQEAVKSFILNHPGRRIELGEEARNELRNLIFDLEGEIQSLKLQLKKQEKNTF